MKNIFLGRPIHWLLALIMVGGGAALGQNRLHVIDFNFFLIMLLAAVVMLIALVLKTSGGDAAITREPIALPPEKEAEENAPE